MCFIVAIIGLVLGFNFFMAGNYLAFVISIVISFFFIFLMLKNILYVKKLKENKGENDDS